jgi:AraC-like DNA-binding protein
MMETLEAAMQRRKGPVSVRARVERMLSSMPSGRLDADAAARALGVSRRTLVRRLAESGANFSALLDAELKRRAERLIAADALSHAQIGERLGYADPTSFSRACRRWFRR